MRYDISMNCENRLRILIKMMLKTLLKSAPILCLALSLCPLAAVLPAVAEQIPSTYLSNLAMSAYRLPGGALTLSYPQNWKLEEKPDKDTLVKFSGTLADGAFGAATVAISAQNQLSLATFCKVLEEVHLSKLPAYRKLSESSITFGRDRKLTGSSRLISFEMGGTKITQRWVIFPVGTDFICMTFLSPSEHYEKVAPLFNDMLLHIASGSSSPRAVGQFSAKNHSPISTAGDADVSRSADTSQYVSIKANGTPLAFSYPKDWQVEDSGEIDHLLKITKKGAPGTASEISLYCSDMPPNTTVEQLMTRLEEKIYNGKKNYRLINRQTSGFGSGPGVEGLEQEMTFEHNGMPFSQRTVSFVVKDKFYVLTLISTKANDVSDRMLFNRIKASLVVSD
jgi:hypothetical protein